MERACMLAERGVGLTRPNPPVGAVVVRNGQVVGEGWHRHAGGPHAEVIALRKAGTLARGATIYVTLEPCSTWGRTPPCTDRILESGIARVVYAVNDPNPRHAGRGRKVLAKAGVEVKSGVCASRANDLLLPFRILMTEGRPMISLKLAVSLDGRIADAQGRSKWITGSTSRDWVQTRRREVDGILVGAGTIRADDPSLLPRPARGRKPWRIVLDGTQPLSLRHRVFADGYGDQTLLFSHHDRADRLRKLSAQGVTVVLIPRGARGYSLKRVTHTLGKLGLLHVLCEGGGQLAAGLIRADLVDRCLWMTAPMLIGNTGSPSVATSWTLPQSPRWSVEEALSLGTDTVFIMTPACPARKT